MVTFPPTSTVAALLDRVYVGSDEVIEVSLIVTLLVATIGPEIEPVRKLNVAISVPSVKLSAVIVLEKEAVPLTMEADPVNALSLSP